ncbi:MAG: ribosome maturation factor RimM [Candidatus Azobacteroides sp.]|nr:ribosome maturation factor RimM [Candidatus Azobacteroides sp.]
MINRDELVPIGRFKKPHGIKGEITFSFTNESFTSKECPFLICEIDGIFVPFRIENYRFISNSTAYVQLKNVDSDQEARILSHKEVYFPVKNIKEEIENDSFTWDSFIGFTLTDQRLGKIGRIVDVDETTVNILFIVERENEEILIPAAEEFIIRIDENQEELLVVLPEGLIE